MRITTKYEVGQNVCFLNCNHIQESVVLRIRIEFDAIHGTKLVYDMVDMCRVLEENVFATKEALVEKLLS